MTITRDLARHCVLGWFSVALTGAREPHSEILTGRIAALARAGTAVTA